MDLISHGMLVAACGQATVIIVYGTIFDWLPRDKFKLLRCPMCLGFWIGILGSVICHTWCSHLATNGTDLWISHAVLPWLVSFAAIIQAALVRMAERMLEEE